MSCEEGQESVDQKFVFLDEGFAGKQKFRPYKPVVFNENFRNMLGELSELRIEIGYGRMTEHEAFSKVPDIVKKYGFGEHINFKDGKIDVDTSVWGVETEIRRLCCSFPMDGDHHRWSKDLSMMYDDLRPIRHSFRVTPIKPTHVEFDKVVKAAVDKAIKALIQETRFRGEFSRKSIGRGVEGALEKAAEEMARQHIILDRQDFG